MTRETHIGMRSIALSQDEEYVRLLAAAEAQKKEAEKAETREG